MSRSEPLAEEAAFHDRWAEDVQTADVKVDQTFTSPSCPENLFILERLGELQDKRVVELGTGLGEGATYMAKRGASTIGADISIGMLRLARRVARRHETSFPCITMDAARLALADESVDVVYAANTLHHIDIASCLEEVHRVLRPGGRAAFWDPVAYNPIINIYRRMAHQVRTDDEHPLDRRDLALMRSLFSRVEVRFFGLATLLVFCKFYFVDMVHPNEERYWKKVVSDYDSIHRLYSALRLVDRVTLSLPGLRWLAWNMAVVLTK
jgi:SAM-dependent methyltransferase